MQSSPSPAPKPNEVWGICGGVIGVHITGRWRAASPLSRMPGMPARRRGSAQRPPPACGFTPCIKSHGEDSSPCSWSESSSGESPAMAGASSTSGGDEETGGAGSRCARQRVSLLPVVHKRCGTASQNSITPVECASEFSGGVRVRRSTGSSRVWRQGQNHLGTRAASPCGGERVGGAFNAGVGGAARELGSRYRTASSTQRTRTAWSALPPRPRYSEGDGCLNTPVKRREKA